MKFSFKRHGFLRYLSFSNRSWAEFFFFIFVTNRHNGQKWGWPSSNNFCVLHLFPAKWYQVCFQECFFFVLDVDPSVFCLNFNFPTHKNGRKFVRVHDFEFFCLLDISNNKFVFKSWTESKVHKIPLICFDLCPYYRLCSGALKMIFCHCPFSYFVHLVHSIVLSVLLFISFLFFLFLSLKNVDIFWANYLFACFFCCCCSLNIVYIFI